MPVAPRITLLTRLALPPETVFALWTRPEHIRHWWGGIMGRVISIQMDPKPRGMFWIAVTRDDGSGFDSYGSYVEVIRGEVLVIDWEHAGGKAVSRVVMQLLKLGDETEITLTHRDFPDEGRRDIQKRRWQEALAALHIYATTLDDDGQPRLKP